VRRDCQPHREVGIRLGAHDAAALRDAGRRVRTRGMRLAEGLARGPFLLVEFLKRTEQDPARLARRFSPRTRRSPSAVLRASTSAGTTGTAAPGPQVLAQRGGRAGVARGPDRGVERGAGVFACLPACSQVGGVGITGVRPTTPLGARRLLPGAHRAAHGPAIDAGQPGDLPQRMTFLSERHDPLIAGRPPRLDRGVLTLQTGG
jgi:hypothetical protein